MTTSLRDALTTAADNPAPPSTVDIGAALATGHRRRVRKLSALAVTATCFLAAIVSVTSSAVRAGPPPRIDPAATTQPPAKQCPTGSPRDTVASPGAEMQQICVAPADPIQDRIPCTTLEPGFLDVARSVLPSVGTWSAPRVGYGCDPGMVSSAHREVGIEVATEHGTGMLWVTVTINPGSGYSRARCNAAEGNVCKPLPEGNLRHLPQPNGDNRVTLDNPKGLFVEVSMDRCVHDLTPAPCAGKPAYTFEQLSELAVALARSL